MKIGVSGAGLEHFHYTGIRTVNRGSVDVGQIYARCSLGAVAHTLRNYAHRYTVGVGYACPTVAGHIQSKRNAYPGHRAYSLEIVVDVVAQVAVVVAFVAFVNVEYRQQIVGGIHRIFIEYLLHLAGPANGEQLACFAAPVHNLTIAQVGLPQESHVDKTHASQIKTEHEYVAGKIKRRIGGEVESLYTPHGAEGQSPL